MSLVWEQVVVASHDPVAHQKHVSLALDALNGGTQAAMRGVPYYDTNYLVTDRLDILQVTPSRAPSALNMRKDRERLSVQGGSSTGGTGSLGTNPSGTGDGESIQDCIDNNAGILAPFYKPLYKPDEGYSWFGLDGAEPGFDCDDFADAIGTKLTKGKAGASYTNVYCKFTGKDPTNGKKSKGAHLITRINSGGQYWLVDGQSGDVSGPHPEDQPMDAGEVLDGYNPVDGTVSTDQTQHAPGDRSAWQGPFSGGPEAWFTSPGIIECFEHVTSMDADDFK